MKSGYVNIRIQTDAKPGDFNIKYILGDDNFWNKSTDNDQYTIITESKLLQIKVEDLHTSILETAKNEHWEVYPNPSEGYVYIGLSGFTNETVLKVYDLNGNLHRTALLYEGLNYMNLNTLSSGQYIISLETASEVRTKRLMIL